MGAIRWGAAILPAALFTLYLLGGAAVAQNASSDENPDPRLADKIARLKDAKLSSRQGAAMSLWCNDPRRRRAYRVALPALHEALKDADPEVRMKAAGAIVTIDSDDPAAVPAFLKLLRHSDARVREQAAADLARLAPHAAETIPVLVDLLRDESAGVRAEAVACLGEFGPPTDDTIGAILPLLKDPDDDVRCAAAQSFRKMGRKARTALPDLIAVAKDRDNPGSLAALHTLYVVAPEDPKVVAVLADALGSDDEDVYDTAAEGLTHSGKAAKAALPALLYALRTRGARGGWAYVIQTLAALGPDAKEAIPELEKWTHDDHPWARKTAAEALKKIRGE